MILKEKTDRGSSGRIKLSVPAPPEKGRPAYIERTFH